MAESPKAQKILTATFRDGVHFDGKKTWQNSETPMESTPAGISILTRGKKLLVPWSNVIWVQVE